MSVAPATLNYNYASVEASRTASASQTRADEATAEQVRANLAAQLSSLEPGTTVTARYQYKVGADGTLLPTQTQITTEANDETDAAGDGTGKRGSRQALTGQSDSRRQSFGDIIKPRAQLSPSDELALFSAASGASDSATPAASSANTVASAAPIAGEAVADDGSKVDVEILTGYSQLAANQNNSAQVLDLTARTQQSAVAALYARNNDLVFSATPLAQLAA